MPRLSVEFKERIRDLSHSELSSIVLKFAARDQAICDYITVKYFDKNSGEQELYEKVVEELDLLFVKSYRGFSVELQKANMLAACMKCVKRFTAVSKNKKPEADLLAHILRETVPGSENMLGTCFTKFDSSVARILKRLIKIVTTEIHADYKIEYEKEINEYLRLLHLHSRHLDLVYLMPRKI
jgi:hypothetical protein